MSIDLRPKDHYLEEYVDNFARNVGWKWEDEHLEPLSSSVVLYMNGMNVYDYKRQMTRRVDNVDVVNNYHQ